MVCLLLDFIYVQYKKQKKNIINKLKKRQKIRSH